MAKNLAKSTTTVGSMTFVSRILGFVRDMIVASFFGAQAGYDAFLVAFKIPNFFRSLFAEGAFSQAFVPLLSEQQKVGTKDEVRSFINHIFSGLLLILVATTILGVIFAPVIISVFAPGFDSDGPRYNQSIQMLRVTFPYLFFISITALFGGILNTYNKFAPPAFTPVLLNISLIVSAIYLSPYFETPVTALAWGVFLGGVSQLVFQLPFLFKIGMLPRFKVNMKDARVRRLLILMAPAVFGVSVVQLNLLLGTVFASFLPVGSVSWLYYAERLMQFPLGVFGVALTTVVLPYLSKRFAEKNEQDYSLSLDWAFRCIFLIATPASLGLLLLAGPLIISLFNYGAFTMHDVVNTVSALKAYALGIVPFIAIKVLSAAFYARQDIKTPVKIAVVALIANAILSLILIQFLAHVGLALATVLAAVVHALLLLTALLKKRMFTRQTGWTRYLLRIIFASALMSTFLIATTDNWTDWGTYHSYFRAMSLGGVVSVAMLIYFGSLWLSGMRMSHVRAPALT